MRRKPSSGFGQAFTGIIGIVGGMVAERAKFVILPSWSYANITPGTEKRAGPTRREAMVGAGMASCCCGLCLWGRDAYGLRDPGQESPHTHTQYCKTHSSCLMSASAAAGEGAELGRRRVGLSS